MTELEVIRQLRLSGYLVSVKEMTAVGNSLRGTMALSAIVTLRVDKRFANGCFYGLHTDVGHDLCDFRSYTGTFGKGSLQLVIDTHTGHFYADVDRANPYEDAVNVIGHMFGEVIPGWLRGWR